MIRRLFQPQVWSWKPLLATVLGQEILEKFSSDNLEDSKAVTKHREYTKELLKGSLWQNHLYRRSGFDWCLDSARYQRDHPDYED